MMRLAILLFLASSVFGPGDGKKNGRKGNALYAQEQYAEAAAEFRLGVSAIQQDGPSPLYSGLLNNLGASLYRSGDMEQAGIAFAGAAQMADSPADMVRASYNAGNAAASSKQLEQALAHYRRALLSDPTSLDAKYNYEFVKRQLEEQQNQDQQQDQQNQDENEKNEDQQKSDQDQENQEQNKDQEQQQQDPQESDEQNSQEQDQQEQKEQPDPTQMSPQEAERILQALENEEEKLLRQVQKMKTRPRRVEKDW